MAYEDENDRWEVVESNKRMLLAVASEPGLWASWLETLAEHPGESALNCASIQAAPYADKSTLLSAQAWEAAGCRLLDGAPPIPLVHRSPEGRFRIDSVYPAEALADPAEAPERAGAVKLDLGRPSDFSAWSRATENVSLSRLSVNALHVVMVRYGIPDDGAYEMPPADIARDIDALCDYCTAIRRQATGTIIALDKAIERSRRQQEHSRPRPARTPEAPALKPPTEAAQKSRPVAQPAREPEPLKPAIERVDLRNINPAEMARIARKAASATARNDQGTGMREQPGSQK